MTLVTDSYIAQLRAAAAGAGLVFAAPIYAKAFNLVPVRLAPALRAALAEMPEDNLWLVGHAATRDVPRIAAVWTLLDELISAMGQSGNARPKRARRD